MKGVCWILSTLIALVLGCSSSYTLHFYKSFILNLKNQISYIIPRAKLFIWQKGGSPLPIHRSRSVPVFNKDESVRQMDSFGGVFRVVPTTPRGAELTVATPISSPKVDAGKFVHFIHLCLFVTRKIKKWNIRIFSNFQILLLQTKKICSLN